MYKLAQISAAKAICVAVAAFGLVACSSAPKTIVVTEPEPIVMPERGAIQANGSIFQAQRGYAPLFEDRRPRMVGDILTILVEEQVSASKSNQTATSRASNVGIDLAQLPDFLDSLADLGLDVSSVSDFNGQGSASANNTFQGTITVQVLEVMLNGNLRVRGEKQIAINSGAEYIRFSGIVNPRSVTGQSTVLSSQVAEARIEYIGDGYIHTAQRMGWLQRFFNWATPM